MIIEIIQEQTIQSYNIHFQTSYLSIIKISTIQNYNKLLMLDIHTIQVHHVMSD